MKKLLFLLIAFTVSTHFIADAQIFLGTKSLYSTPTTTLTDTPAGYSPVFINHVGRHGARHLTKEVTTSFGYAILAKADSAKALTAKGQALFQMVKALAKVEKGKVKSISEEGIAELQGIGERMQAHYSGVFKTSANLNVTETKEIRTKQSADAFLSGLKKNMGKEPVIKEYIDDTNLRFYDFSPVYKQFEEDGEWVKYRQALATQVRLEQVNNIIATRAFTGSFLKTLTSANRDKLVSDIFGFAAITYSLKQEIKDAGFKTSDTNFISLFTPQEISVLAQLDQADDYYQKGPGIDPNGIQARIAAPLLANFITTADEFMKTGTYNAQLRFAHAETISPFATFLGISTADKSTKTTRIGAYWQAANVIPLSANIQWIFYKNAAGNYLVKILLNEKEVHITGLATTSYPYYSWTKLREFYMDKLQKLHIGLTDDMNSYLQNVK
jgi:multiple inositol-polyphosphate phosphatase/2,3-bisphosphoglycerate 3-phosphatase